jgi:hypothetical protein
MKRSLAILLIMAFTGIAFGQKSKMPNVEKGECFIYQGHIDKYPIALIFEEFAKEITGRYYYKNIQTAIEIEGSKNDSGYTFKTKYDVNAPERFALRITDNELYGTWVKGQKKLSVSLARFNNPISIYRLKKSLKSESFKKGSSSELTIKFTVLWPEDASDFSQKLREDQFKLINEYQYGQESATAIKFKQSIDPRTVQGQPQQLISQMQRISDSMVSQFKRETLSSPNDFLGNREHYIQNSIIFDSDQFTVIETYHYEYTGGAHGIWGQQHQTWEKSKSRWATADNKLTSKQLLKLPKLMTTNHKIALKIPQNQSLKSVGYWIDEFDRPGSDTYFTDRGIHTSFGLYEIAPYSEGIISVFVPWY